MRRDLQLLVALSLAAPAAAQDPHAHHAEPAHESHGAAVVSPTARIRTTHDAGEGVIRIAVGPFHLPPAGDAGSMQIARARTVALPSGGWFTGFRVRVVDGAGNELPSSHIHHVNLVMPGRRDLFTPGLYRLAAAGAETAPIELPWPFALALGDDESLLVVAMVHNETDRTVHDATVEILLDYVPFGGVPRIRVETIYLDAVEHGLGTHTWDLPPGPSRQSWEGSPAIPGRILALGGHMHRYGTRLLLEDVTAGDTLWQGAPEYGPDGDIVAMPRGQFVTRLGIPLDTAHVYRITAFYENPTGRTIADGAMGTIAGIFKPDRKAVWPAADPLDPFYRRDLRAVTSSSAP